MSSTPRSLSRLRCPGTLPDDEPEPPDHPRGKPSKPGWLATRDQLWAGWLHDGEVLAEAKREAVRMVPLTRPVAAAKMSALARCATLVSSAR